MRNGIESSVKRRLLQGKLDDMRKHIVRFIYSYDRLAKLSYEKIKKSSDLRWLYEREYENAIYIRDTLITIAYLLEDIRKDLRSNSTTLEKLEKLEKILTSLIYNAKSLPDELVFRINELRGILSDLLESKLFYV